MLPYSEGTRFLQEALQKDLEQMQVAVVTVLVQPILSDAPKIPNI